MNKRRFLKLLGLIPFVPKAVLEVKEELTTAKIEAVFRSVSDVHPAWRAAEYQGDWAWYRLEETGKYIPVLHVKRYDDAKE